MIDLILTGLSILTSVGSIISSINRSTEDSHTRHTVRDIQGSVNSLRETIDSTPQGSQPNPAVLSAYHKIIQKVQNEPSYRDYIQLRRTTSGTWMVIRKKKSTILRDPEGEYCDGCVFLTAL